MVVAAHTTTKEQSTIKLNYCQMKCKQTKNVKLLSLWPLVVSNEFGYKLHQCVWLL